MITQDTYNIKKLFLIFLLFGIILSFVNITTEKIFFEDETKKIALENAIKKIQERENVLDNFLEQSRVTLHSLQELTLFQKYLHNSTDKKLTSQITDIFLAYSKSQPFFMQLRYIDKNGFEQIRIDRKNEKSRSYVVDRKNLQNKSNRYYFYDSKTKPLNKVWFSAIDLNMEKGKVEIPYRSTIRVILPISKNGTFDGIVIINYFINEFLLQLTNAPFYDIILTDGKGFPLFHYDSNKSWGYYQNPQYNISEDFPTNSTKILNNQSYKTDFFVSKNLNTTIIGGLNLILQLKKSYLEKLKLQSYVHYSVVSIINLIASLILTFFIIRYFSRTLLNIEVLTKYTDKLKEESMRKNLALQIGTVAIWEWTYKTDKLYLDDIMYEMYGFDKQNESEPLYSMWLNTIFIDQKEDVEKQLLYAKKNNTEFNTKFWILTPQKEKKYIHCIGKNYCNRDDIAVRMIGISTDITETIKYQTRLQEQKEEFESIFKYTKDGIAILDLNSNFLEFNDAYVEMTGYTREELLTKSCIGLTAPEDLKRSIHALETVLEIGHLENFEKTCIVKDGKRIETNIAISIMPDKKRFLLITKNVSSLKVLESQSRLASMGEMIGNIAHQWRQPLSIITTAASGLEVKADFNQEITTSEIQKFSQIIVKQAEYLSNTIDDFRNFIKGDDAHLQISVQQALKDSLNLTEASRNANFIELIEDIESDFITNGNKNELEQVFINILNNSKDILVEKKDLENKYVFISFQKNTKDTLEIKILDNGGGIDESVIQKIFEPYFTTKHKSIGTGLGLSMANKIIRERYNGFIRAYNEEYTYKNKNYKGACTIITIKSNLDNTKE